MTILYASILKHPLNTGVHFVFIDKLAARDLIDSNLNLLLKPFMVHQKTSHSFLQQIVGGTSGLCGQFVQLSFLNLREMNFHIDYV